jgi:hypothetical protein
VQFPPKQLNRVHLAPLRTVQTPGVLIQVTCKSLSVEE